MGVLLLLSMNSCTQERLVSLKAQSETGVGLLAFNLDNDALRSVPAENFEKEVNPESIWAVFFTSTSSGAQTFKVAKQATKTPSGSYMIEAGFEGNAQVFVIGNVQDGLKTALEALTPGSTLDDVQKLVVKNALGDDNTTPDQFIMTSEMVTVNLPAKGAPMATLSSAIKLKRLAARFDVINEVPGLTLTTVSVANRIVSSTLFDVSKNGSDITPTTDYTITDGKVLLHKIYSYQNINKGGTTGATSFTLKGKYKGSPLNRPIEVELQDATTGQPIDVKRNYCYRILLKPSDNNDKPINPDDPTSAWKVTIKVLDWNKAATDLANYSDEYLAENGDYAPSYMFNPRGTNLLLAVADYNLDVTGTNFVFSHSNEAGKSGYFLYSEIHEPGFKLPKGYHIPTLSEWCSILGEYGNNERWVFFDKQNAGSIKQITETYIKVPDRKDLIESETEVLYFENRTYALRYKNYDDYRSAWRYSYEDGPIAGQKVLKIECVPVSKQVTSVRDLVLLFKDRDVLNTRVKTRYFPALGCGYNRDGSGDGSGRGLEGYYMASTGSGVLRYRLDFDSTGAIANSNGGEIEIPIRLFRGEEP